MTDLFAQFDHDPTFDCEASPEPRDYRGKFSTAFLIATMLA